MKNKAKQNLFSQTLQSMEHNIILLGMGSPLDFDLIYS